MKAWLGPISLIAAAHAGNLAPASGVYAASLGAGAATAAERSGFGQNPAALRPGGAGLRLDYHRPYGLEDLAVAEAGLWADGGRAGIALDWRATSITGLYSEHGFRLAPSFRIASGSGFPGTLDAGAGFTGWRQSLAGSGAAWDMGWEAGLCWRPWPRLAGGVFASGLRVPEGRDAPGRILQFGFAADSRPRAAPGNGPESGQSLRLDFRKSGAGPWRALASLSIRPFPGVEATFGAASPPFQAAAGLAVSWRGFRVRQAFRYHRYLGKTWLSGAALALRRPGPQS